MIFLSLGSNLPSKYGDRFDNLKKSIFYIVRSGIVVNCVSSFYETLSYPDNSKPKFINIVISIKTNMQPTELMSTLINIEEKLDRKRSKKNDPRTCDIDIIDYDKKILNFKYKNTNLEIPHKKISVRNFVLYPLEEIEPNWKHPKTKENIQTLIKALPEEDRKSILKLNKMI